MSDNLIINKIIRSKEVMKHQCINQDGQAEFRIFFSDETSAPFCAKCVRNSPIEWWGKLK